MAYKADIYQVMIASPNDVPRERQLAKEIIYEWNSINSYDKGICLLPVMWETNSNPEMGQSPQGILNKQILETSDLLIGIFWTRIGSPTGKSISGSVEEIEKHVEAKKPTMLYFSDTPVALSSVDKEQYQELEKFKKECYDKGIVETFSSKEDFGKKLTRHLSLKINRDDYFKVNEHSNIKKYEKNNFQKLIEELSKSEKQLLIEASKDSNGNILRVETLDGYAIQTNGKRLNEDSNPRTKALWNSTIYNLLANDLIEEVGYKGEIFNLTLNGYKFIDKLEEK